MCPEAALEVAGHSNLHYAACMYIKLPTGPVAAHSASLSAGLQGSKEGRKGAREGVPKQKVKADSEGKENSRRRRKQPVFCRSKALCSTSAR